jgi:chromosomal replication initiation ATPase DnaA
MKTDHIPIKEITGAAMIANARKRNRANFRINRIARTVSPVSADLREETRRGGLVASPGRPSLERIARLCMYWLKVEEVHFYGNTREATAVTCRQLFSHVARRWNKNGRQVEPRWTTAEIGNYLGKDHSTITTSLGRITETKVRHRRRQAQRRPVPQFALIKAAGCSKEEIDAWI